VWNAFHNERDSLETDRDMSVFRQPGVLGRSTRRRVVGVTAALSAAAVEMLAVGELVRPRRRLANHVDRTRGARGALLRVAAQGRASSARRSAISATSCNRGDWRDGPAHDRVARLAARGRTDRCRPRRRRRNRRPAGILTAQFLLEQRVFRRYASTRVPFTPVVPDSCWPSGVDATRDRLVYRLGLTSPPVSLGVTTVVLKIEALHIGVLVFRTLRVSRPPVPIPAGSRP